MCLDYVPLLACALMAVATAATADVPLVEDGRPLAAIVVTPEATETERFAAEEIRRIVRESTGAELQITTDVPDDAAFVSVGRTAAAEQLGYEADAANPDPYMIRTGPDRVFVLGRGDRGTIYAAYDLLRRIVGARWVMPGAIGEIIPRRADVIVPEMDLHDAPAFRFRIAAGFRDEDYRVWASRNRLQVLSQSPGAWAEPAMEKLGGYVKGTMHHAFDSLLPEEQYYEDHPEYYALVGDERVPGRRAQLCVSNRDVRRIVAEKAIAFFDEHPEATFFSLCPNDTQTWCECEACRAYDTETMQRWGREYPVVSDRYFAFVNAVADRLAEVHPDKLLYTFAYQNYTWPPKTHLPRENVIVSLCHMVPACYSHPLTDPECEKNVQFNELLGDWADVHDNMWYYAYTCKSMWEGMPWPIARRLATDIRRLDEAGFRGFYSQGSQRLWGQLGFNFYVMARMLWEPQADVEATLDEYFELAFGPAADAMRDFYGTLEESFTAPDVHVHHEVELWAEAVLDAQTREACTSALSRAVEQAGGDPDVRARIAPVAAAYRYAELRVEALQAERQWRDAGDVGALRRATEAYAEIMQIAEDNPGDESVGWGSVNRYVRPRHEALVIPYDALVAPEDERGFEWQEAAAWSFEDADRAADEWSLPDYGDDCGVEPSTAHAADGESSLRLWSAVQSEESERWTALQSGWVVANAVSRPIEVEPGQAILITARVHVPEDFEMTDRGATLGLIGYDADGKAVPRWTPGSIEVRQETATDGWRQMMVGRIIPAQVEAIAVRLAVCGVGECFFDEVRVRRGHARE